MITNDDGYLFIIRNVPEKFLETQDEGVRKLQESTVTKIYRVISEKALKNTPTGQWNLIRSHNMRKYFNSVMLNAGADSFFTEFCMGHTLDSTREAYFRASPEKLKEIYQKYIPYLTLEKALDVSESPEYQQIKKENQILQVETARHVVERSELQEIRAEIERMTKIKKDEDEIQAATIAILQERPDLEKIMEKILEKKLSSMGIN